MTAREVAGILAEHGFVCVSQRGSHRKWRNEAQRLQVIVPDPEEARRALDEAVRLFLSMAAERGALKEVLAGVVSTAFDE